MRQFPARNQADVNDVTLMSGTGPFDYVCAECLSTLAASVEADAVTGKRLACRRCKTLNDAPR